MFSNRTADGRNNICGTVVAKLRKELRISQRELADRLKSGGLDIDKNAVQRIESGQRFVTDIELIFISKVLNVTINVSAKPPRGLKKRKKSVKLSPKRSKEV